MSQVFKIKPHENTKKFFWDILYMYQTSFKIHKHTELQKRTCKRHNIHT